LTQFQNGLPTISAIHRHTQNLPALIRNPIQQTIHTTREVVFPIIEFLLTQMPPYAQQALEAITALQPAQVNTAFIALSQEAVPIFTRLQPQNVQHALIQFCPHIVQAGLTLFPNQIAVQAANQAGGIARMAINIMPQAMLNAIVAPALTTQLQNFIMQIPPDQLAQISPMLANRAPAEITQFFRNLQQEALTWLPRVQDFYQRLVIEFGDAPLAGLTQGSESLLQRLNAFDARNQPGDAALAEMQQALKQNGLLKERRQATELAMLHPDRKHLPEEMALKIFSYLKPALEQQEEAERENNFLKAYRLAIRKPSPATSTVAETSQKRLREEGTNDNDSQDAGPSTSKRVKKA